MSENIGKYNILLELITRQTGDLEKIKKDANSLQSSFDSAKKAFVGLTAVAAVVKVTQAIGELSGKAIQLAADFEAVTKSFKILLGSKAEADRLVIDLERFALETPFESKDILAAAKTLLGYGRAAREVKEDIALIGNAAAATGANLSSLSLVFGQVAGVGRLMQQDAQQFITAGIPVYQVLGDYLQKDIEEIKKLQSEGKITFDILREAFEKASAEGGKFYGALEEQANSYAGLTAANNEYRENILWSFGEILLPFLKAFYQVWNEILKEASDRMIELAESIKPAVEVFISGLKPVLDGVLRTISALTGIIGGLLVALVELPKFIYDNKKAIGLLIIALATFNGHLIAHEINTLRSIIATKAKAAADYAAAAATWVYEKAQRALNIAMRLNPIGAVIGLVIALVSGLVLLYNQSEKVRLVVAGLWEALKVGAENALRGIKEMITNIRIFGKEIQIAITFDSDRRKQLRDELEELRNMKSEYAEAGRTLGQAFRDGYNEQLAKERKKKMLEIMQKEADAAGALFKQLLDEKPEEKKITKVAQKSAEDILKEQYNRNVELVSKNYALREKDARDTIKDAKALAERLKQIEIEKRIALLTIKQQYAKKDSAEFYEIGNQIAELERQYDSLFEQIEDDIIKSYLLREQKAIDTIKRTSELEAELKKIDFEKKLYLLNKQLQEEAEGSTAYIQLTNQIKLLNKEYNEFLENQKKHLVVLNQFADTLQTLKQEFETYGFDLVNLDELLPADRIPALKGRLNTIIADVTFLKQKIKDGNADPLDLDLLSGLQDEGDKIIEMLRKLGIDIGNAAKELHPEKNILFGLTEEELRLATEAIDVARDAFSTITDLYISELDRRLAAQQDRVNKAADIAEKGNVEQLQLEQARLDELEAKREAAMKKQSVLEKAAAQAQIAVNTLMTVSNIQVGAAKTFAQTGVAAPVTLPIILAVVGGLIASAASLFKPAAFFKGTEEVSSDPQFSKYKYSNGRDGYWARFDGSERIVDGATNKKLKGIPNALLPRAVKALEILQYPKVNLPAISPGGQAIDISDLKDEMKALRQSVESMKIETKIDMDGFTQRLTRQFDRVERRKIIKG